MFKLSNFDSLGRKIAGFVLLLVGLVFLFFVLRNTVRDFPIWFFGQSVSGVVDETWYEMVEENAGEMSFTYFVSYHFTAPNGETHTNSSRLSAQEWMALSSSGEVIVVYSSLNPENNRIDDSRFIPLLFCSYLPFVAATWFFLTNGWKLLYAEFKEPDEELWVVEKKVLAEGEEK
ncbi:MAG: DUF3592 domain-containing protein [Chloroflexota bacterium]